MSFPEFPIFRKLVTEDRAAYLRYYKRAEPYSDFSFNNLLVWLDINNDLEIARHHECLVLRFSNPFEEGKQAYTIIGNQGCRQAVTEIFEHLRLTGQEPRMVMVPECVISDILSGPMLPQNLVIRANVDHRDYVYDIKNTLELKGKVFAELRHSLNVFDREYGDRASIKTLSLNELSTKHVLMDALKKWHEASSFTKNDPRFEEAEALKRYFSFIDACPAKCLAFFLDEKLFGFSIFHLPPQKGWAIGNHIKCDPSVRYAFDFMVYATMSVLHKEGIEYVNGEQDLGIGGLRTHKRQLGPVDYLYRYDISLA